MQPLRKGAPPTAPSQLHPAKLFRDVVQVLHVSLHLVILRAHGGVVGRVRIGLELVDEVAEDV